MEHCFHYAINARISNVQKMQLVQLEPDNIISSLPFFSSLQPFTIGEETRAMAFPWKSEKPCRSWRNVQVKRREIARGFTYRLRML